MKNEHRILTLAEAQRVIEFNSTDTKGRLLREELRGREERTGQAIMTRRKRGKRTTYRVTIAAIRKHAPDLMPSKADELLKEARSYLCDIDRRIDDRVAEQITERVEPRFEKLERTVERTAETVRDMSSSFKRLATAGSPKIASAQ
jgi:hypothetical protein